MIESGSEAIFLYEYCGVTVRDASRWAEQRLNFIADFFKTFVLSRSFEMKKEEMIVR